MPDDLVIENLQDIIDSIELIVIRFTGINTADDFVKSSDGVLILDSICMRLQIIGELLKKFKRFILCSGKNILKLSGRIL